ncbi:MAG: transposase [Kribbellaceae bacterium]|nr:transposase [Kribbellaceae bacterium]
MLTPVHHESDTRVHRGRITKQGSRLVRWAMVESVQILPDTTTVGQFRDRVAARRGRNIGVVAVGPHPSPDPDASLRRAPITAKSYSVS